MKALFTDIGTFTISSDDSEERLLLKELLTSASVGVVSPKLPKLSITASQVLGGAVTGLTIGLTTEQATQSTAIDVANIAVVNHVAGTADTVKVSNLVAGDTVKVYSDSALTTTVAIGTVASSKTSITLLVDDLGATAGTVYVTKTSTGELESASTAVSYLAEA